LRRYSEAHFREQELRMVDISKRVALVEETLDRELQPLREWQGLTPVHFSAQRKRFVWDRGCI
jgi:hypothetical protein